MQHFLNVVYTIKIQEINYLNFYSINYIQEILYCLYCEILYCIQEILYRLKYYNATENCQVVEIFNFILSFYVYIFILFIVYTATEKI